jgi:predicted alpha/beta-fold hydrolase
LHRTFYSKALGQNLQAVYRSHLPALQSFPPSPGIPTWEQIISLKSPQLIEVDELLVSKTGGATPPWPFPSANEYYVYASSDRSLPDIRVPFLAISSKDDPIVQEVPTHCGNNGWCAVVLTEVGGHLGWFEDKDDSRWKFDVQKWVRKPVLEWLKATIEDFKRENTPNVDVEVVDGFTREKGRPEIGFKEIDKDDLPKYIAKTDGVTAGL